MVFELYEGQNAELQRVNVGSVQFYSYSRGCTSRVQPRATPFKIYVNDMTYAPKKVKFILFADDTILNINTKSHSHIVEISNRELPKVVRWIYSNKFILNSY